MRLPPPTHSHLENVFIHRAAGGLLGSDSWGGGQGLTAPTQPSPPRGLPLSSTPWPPGLQFISFPGPSVLYRLLKEDGPTSRTYSCKLRKVLSSEEGWSGLSSIQG